MDNYVSIIVSVFLFLVSLFLFKAIFPALGIALLFLLLTTVLEAVWEYRETPLVLNSINLVISAILALALYALIYLPIEFLITEILLITPEIFSFVSLIFLLVLIIIFSLVSWNKVLKTKSLRWKLAVFVAVSGLVYGVYRHQKLAREYLPKIYEISPGSGIQAEIIEIRGVNFHPIWKKGKIYLGEDEMVVRDWNEELIKAEQPVPSKFGQVELWVERKDGVVSNKMVFEIKDAGKLNN